MGGWRFIFGYGYTITVHNFYPLGSSGLDNSIVYLLVRNTDDKRLKCRSSKIFVQFVFLWKKKTAKGSCVSFAFNQNGCTLTRMNVTLWRLFFLVVGAMKPALENNFALFSFTAFCAWCNGVATVTQTLSPRNYFCRRTLATVTLLYDDIIMITEMKRYASH